MELNNTIFNPASSILPPATPGLSKAQKKKAKEKLKKAQGADWEKTQTALVQTAILSAASKFPTLSPEMKDFSTILFNSISFDPTRSVIEAWAIYCAKTIRTLNTVIEKTKTPSSILSKLEWQIHTYYYLLQVYYQKLDCLARCITKNSIFEDDRYFPSNEMAKGEHIEKKIKEIIASIPAWKQGYFQQSKVSKLATERLWTQIEKDLRADCDSLINAIGFVKEIVLHPLAKELMMRSAQENFSNAALMVKDDVEQTKQDLACLLDLMEKSIDESTKDNKVAGVIAIGTIKRLNNYYKQVKDKKVMSHEDVITFIQLQLKEESDLKKVEELNVQIIRRIVADPHFTHDVWCRENNINAIREKSPDEFLSMMYQSYIHAMILHDFNEVFAAVLSRHVIQKANPDRLKINHAALNKFVFGFTIVEKLKKPETREQFLLQINHSIDLCKKHPATATFKQPFMEQIDVIIKNMIICIDNQALDTKEHTNALLGKNPTLDSLWRMNRVYLPFQAKVLEINKSLEKILKSIKKSVEVTIPKLPLESINQEIESVNDFFKTLHVVLTTTIAAPVLVVREMDQLIADSWANGEYKPHIIYTERELEQDLVTAIEKIVPTLSFEQLFIPEEPKLQPKTEPVEVIELTPVPVTEIPVPPSQSQPVLKEKAHSTKTASPPPKIEKKQKEEKLPKAIKVRDLLKKLYEEGFKGVRMRGDHLIVARGTETFSVPVANTHVSPGVLNGIQKILNEH